MQHAKIEGMTTNSHQNLVKSRKRGTKKPTGCKRNPSLNHHVVRSWDQAVPSVAVDLALLTEEDLKKSGEVSQLSGFFDDDMEEVKKIIMKNTSRNGLLTCCLCSHHFFSFEETDIHIYPYYVVERPQYYKVLRNHARKMRKLQCG
ncbi:hypothetical protein Y032_0296g1705 [Ancylostoma ceylanicum]|uniref:Uncharacterized protein n=1 Tax=Ancylostoma ceylanicum TaxID=53326 RepID=A0A016S4M6_9BILA|nr:hypothetical protein Y032_0296g1705 [Ancylostoma ceylanicum]